MRQAGISLAKIPSRAKHARELAASPQNVWCSHPLPPVTQATFCQPLIKVWQILCLSVDPVRFIASKSGSPDLPPWLRFEQKDPTDRAFIYGTPGREVSSQIILEVRKV